MVECEQQMMLWRDVNWKLDLDLFIPSWRCVVMKNRTCQLSNKEMSAVTWSSVNALKVRLISMIEINLKISHFTSNGFES